MSTAHFNSSLTVSLSRTSTSQTKSTRNQPKDFQTRPFLGVPTPVKAANNSENYNSLTRFLALSAIRSARLRRYLYIMVWSVCVCVYSCDLYVRCKICTGTFPRPSGPSCKRGMRSPGQQNARMGTGREEPRTAACHPITPGGNPRGREKEKKSHRRRESRDGDDTLGRLGALS